MGDVTYAALGPPLTVGSMFNIPPYSTYPICNILPLPNEQLPRPGKLIVKIIPRSSRIINIQWDKLHGYSQYTLHVRNTSKNKSFQYMVQNECYSIHENVIPGDQYEITIQVTGIGIFDVKYHRGAILVEHEMKQLFACAVQFMLATNDTKMPIFHMYRNKPRRYFEDIFNHFPDIRTILFL